MCGILGVISNKDCVKDAIQAFEFIRHRGHDCFGISDGKRTVYTRTYPALRRYVQSMHSPFILLHNLHSLSGFQKQPIDHCFVANCEIYNYRDFGFHENDAKSLFYAIKENMKNLEKMHGPYALAYAKGNTVILARDRIGEKPLLYGKGKGIVAFASEGKVLKRLGIKNPIHLDPQEIAYIDLQKKSIHLKKRKGMLLKRTSKNEKEAVQKVKKLLFESVRMRIPQQKLGILFSGGIDSFILALLCKKLGKECTVYTVAFQEGNIHHAKDLIAARKAAQYLNIPLKEKVVGLAETERYIQKVVPLIESADVVQTGCALPFFIAAEMAKQDGCKVLFSGFGSDEIFGGYQSHQQAKNVNLECRKRIKNLYKNDLYRDDVVTMAHTLELRLPFLDTELVDYALTLHPRLKVHQGIRKYILRKLAGTWGVPETIAWRKKVAAQYGSNSDKIIFKLSKKNHYPTKKEYLKSLLR